VVKEERYFAPANDAQGSGPAGGSELLGQRRSLEPSSTRRYRARVGSSRTFPGEFLKVSVGRTSLASLGISRSGLTRPLRTSSLAGGEDYGYFASNAGDAGSNPAARICARVV